MNNKLFLSAAVGLTALAIWLSAPVPRNSKAFSKSSILQILSELYTSLKPCCLKIAKYTNTIKSNSPNPPSTLELKQFLISDFSISDLLTSHKAPIYSSWNISESELDHYITTSLKSDTEVQNSYKKIQNLIENACMGFVLEETCYVPNELTSQQALEILSEIYSCELYFVNKKRKIKEENCEEIEDWEIDFEFSDQEIKCKANVFAKFGVKVEESKVIIAIRQAIRNFSLVDDNFQNLHRELEVSYNMSLGNIYSHNKENGFQEFIERKYEYYMNLDIN